MTDPVVMSLARGGVVAITTTGRSSGQPHAVEVALHNLDSKLMIGGRPGSRDWYANLVADPRLTISFRNLDAIVPATARPVADWSERRRLMEVVMIRGFGFSPERTHREIALWVTRSPLVVVEAEWPGWVNR